SFHEQVDQRLKNFCHDQQQVERLNEVVAELREKLRDFQRKKNEEFAELRSEFLKQIDRRRADHVEAMARKEVELEEWRELFNDRLKMSEQNRREDMARLQQRIDELENQLFSADTQLTKLEEERDHLTKTNQQLM